MKRLLMLLIPLLGVLTPTLAHDGNNGVTTSLSYRTVPNPLVVNKEGTVRFQFRRENQTLIQATECKCTVLVYAGLPDPKVRPQATGKLVSDQEGLLFKFKPTKAGMFTLVLDAKPTKHDDFQVIKLYLPLMVEEP